MQPKLLLRYIFVTLALLFAVLGIVSSSYAWLSGWDQRIELTTDHTVVDATLSNFPVYVNLSTSSGKTPTDVSAVFDEVGANWQKIAIANSSDTECYVEKVSWDDTGEIAELHVKLVSVSNSADENWYLYYDNDHVDNTVYVKGVGDATDVWDSNFVMVQNMEDATTSTIIDSTSNSNDGAKKAVNEPIEAAGQIGEGQDFDGSDDYITLTNMAETANGSISLWFKPTNDINSSSSKQNLVVNADDGSITIFFQFNFFAADGKASFDLYYSGNWNKINSTETSWTAGIWYYFTAVWGSDGLKIYVNDSLSNYDNALTGAPEDIAENWRIGVYSTSYFNGTIDEVCISSIARSADWIKASYYSGKDNLLTFGNEETQGGLVTPFGLGVDIFEVIQ